MQQQQKPQQPDQNFPLAGIAMDFLRKDGGGKERFYFCRQGQEALEVGIKALFASGKPAAPALSDLLGLATALELQMRSPSAAVLIRAAVRGNAQALMALGISGASAANRRSTTKLIGQAKKENAPVFGAAAPRGSISVASLVDPMQFDRARAKNLSKPAAAPALQKAPINPSANRRRIA